MSKKIILKHFRQTPGFCGPAVLKILLSHFKKEDFTEEQLAKLTNATAEIGAEHEGLIQTIKELGGFVFTKENGTLGELEYFVHKEKLPVIIGWFDPLNEGDHYSIVVDLSKKHITIVDPSKFGPERKLERKSFPEFWFDFVGKENRIASWGWYMVVNFEKKRFQKIQGGYYF